MTLLLQRSNNVRILSLNVIVFALFSIGFTAFAQSNSSGPKNDFAQHQRSIDTNHSEIGFKVKHLGLSYVRGHFDSYTASLESNDAGKLSSVEATAQVKSINTGIAKRDNHLQGEDFFHAAKYPNLSLSLDRFRWRGDDFKATGTLTMRGIKRKIVFIGERQGTHVVDFGSGPQQRVGYTLRTKVKRSDYGLLFNKLAEGVAVVADEVIIELEVQTTKPT